jgi:hypothetical protein
VISVLLRCNDLLHSMAHMRACLMECNYQLLTWNRLPTIFTEKVPRPLVNLYTVNSFDVLAVTHYDSQCV